MSAPSALSPKLQKIVRRKTKAEREHRISKATDDLVAKLTPGVETAIQEMRTAMRKQKLPVVGEPRIGDLTRSQAIAYSKQFVSLAFMLNQVADDLPDTPEETKRRKEFVPRGISI